MNAFYEAGLEPDIKYTIYDDFAIMTMVEADPLIFSACLWS